MSTIENKFIGWFAGIAASLIIAVFLRTFSILGSMDVMAEKVRRNENECMEIMDTHKNDVGDIKDDIREIKQDIKDDIREIKQDIKKLLSE